MKFTKSPTLVLSMMASFVIGLFGVLVIFSPSGEAATNIERFYYTTQVQVVLEPGDAPVNTALLVGSLQPGEKWESFYNDDGMYILKVSAPAGRHSQIVRESSFLGEDIAAVRVALNEEARLSGLRSSIQRGWQGLKDRGCTVPLNPSHIVGGSVTCP